MLKIVAIGGGEIGRPGFPVETTAIDRDAIRLTGKKHPRILFIPTASNDSASYYAVFQKHFAKRLGCKTDVLYLLGEKCSKVDMKTKLDSADMVYVGGGNTMKMLRAWRRTGFASLIMAAAKKGKVLSGVSAGAVCWFSFANSDSRRMIHKRAPYIRVRGLGLVKGLLCPHFDVEPKRYKSLPKMMKRTPGVCLAADNCAAIEVVGNSYRILHSKKSSRIQKMFWKKGKWHEEILISDSAYRPLKNLLKAV